MEHPIFPKDDTRDPLERAFDELLDAAERGDAAALEAIGARHPEMSAEVKQRLAELARGGRTGRSSGTAARATSDAAAGALPFERVGDFRLVRPLARGGMGQLFLAEQISLRRPVALKLLAPERWASASAQATFRREAETLAGIRHQNVVTVFASGVERDVPWLAMELLDGRTLEQMLVEHAGRPLPVARMLRVGAQVARALQCAHASGVIHRDVKPSNVFVTKDDRAVLIDFGIARAVLGEHLTMTGEFRGTPSYASPEQIAPRATPIDGRTDVYSLGATLYEASTGGVPFSGETTEQLFHQILTREPESPRKKNPALPRDVEIVLLKALEKEPERRYASAADFADDLEALLEIRPIRARPAGPATRTIKWTRRNPAATLAILLVVVFLAALPVLIALRDRSLGRARVDEARARVAALADLRRRLVESDRRVVPLEMSLNRRFLNTEEHRAIAAGNEETARLAREFDESFFGAISMLNDARRFTPDDPAIDALLADLYVERWRRSIDARDDAGAAVFASLAEAADRENRHAATLHAKRALAVTSDPAGATVHLFRYREHSAIVTGGDHRLVPVPIGKDGAPVATPVDPGARCLRVVNRAEGVEPGDLVLKFAGRPIENVVLVPRDAPDGSIKAFDRLVSIDGKPVREAYDVSSHYDDVMERPDVERAFEFERDGASFTLRATGLAALGVNAWEPDNVLSEVGGAVELWHDGEVRSIVAPPVFTLTTAVPAFTSPANRAGVTPLSGVELEPGSYLAIVSGRGRAAARMPFVIERDFDASLAVETVAEDAAPPGYVWVPGGPFATGGDRAAFAGLEARVVDVPGFWIQQREVTWGEWLQFVNSPESLAELDARAPRGGDRGEINPKWKQAANGEFSIPPGRANFPISGISFRDAEAYVAWLNERALEAGRAWEFSIPTELEWEKAARGVDGRAFPFGNRFQPQWVKSRFARDREIDETTLRFPIDESPYGVFDTCGSEWEMCSDAWAAGDPSRVVRGGAWDLIYEANFRVASRAAISDVMVSADLGLRIVARPRQKE